MRTLLLIRHAEAVNPTIGGVDYERVLTAYGLEQAFTLGQLLVKHDLKPEYVLCSGATRTRQTLDRICEGGDFTSLDVTYKEQIYKNGPDWLLEMISMTDDNVQTLMVIGHNPTVHTLAVTLAGGSPAARMISDSYPPATVSVITFEGDWLDFRRTARQLERVISPDRAP